MSNSDKLIFIFLSFIGGICIASYFFSFPLISFLLSLILIIFKKRWLGVCLIFFSLGMFLFQVEINKINYNPLISLNEKEVILTGIISGEVKKGIDKTQIIVDVIEEDKLIGKALIYADKYSSYKYRDKISIEGLARVPQKLEKFDYQGYLAKSGVVITFSYPKMEIIERKVFSNYFQKIKYSIYEFKNNSAQRIKDILPPQLSPILEAMILGNDFMMSKELKADLSKSGLSHVIAISGSHIVLFSAMIFWLLIVLGFWRKQALVVSIIFTFFYVFLVGMIASALRAGIMMALLFLAEIFDRKAFNLKTLVIAGFFMLLFNPLLLKYDLGFQLSFLAVGGIILMGPVFNHLLSFIKWKYLREIIAVTLSAQIFTLPILISSFGYFSIISIITNIIVLPVTPLLMALGILVPFIPIPFLISIPCTILLWYLMMIVQLGAQMPFSILNVQIPIIFLLFSYLPLILLSYKNKKKDLEFLGQ